jgi:pilus assembly protein CpaB
MLSGSLITRDVVKRVAWPAQTPLPGGFDNIDMVVDRGLISSVVENEPLTEAKLAPKGAGAGLPPSIPSGMRAVSVRVNEVIGVAGFVVPGTRVDLVVTFRVQNDTVSRVVVSNVQVLTAGTRYDQENAQKEGKPIPTTVVTLLVSPEDAEKIALAQTEGQLMLTLRNPADNEPTETHGARTASLLGAPPPAPVAAKPVARRPAPTPPVVAAVAPAPEPPRPYTVEAIRAAKRSEERVRTDGSGDEGPAGK